MKKTEQYNLNQWEASDRIRMEDFNADNQRVEAALIQKPGRAQLIAQQTFTSEPVLANAAFHVLKDGNWSDWERIAMFVDLHGITHQTGDLLSISMCTEDHTFFDPRVTIPFGSFVLSFYPFHDGKNKIRAVVSGSGSGAFFLDDPYEDVGFLTMTACGSDGITSAVTKLVKPTAYTYGVR